MIIAYKGKQPVISDNVFIAPTATIIGDVNIEAGASIWYGTVLRGDLAPIFVGKNTNIQDNCTVHTDAGKPAKIGDWVTIGHNCVIHGCTVHDHSLVGMGSVVMNEAQIHSGSIVASGSVVREKQRVGPNHLVGGVPARVIKTGLESIAVADGENPAEIYMNLAREHAAMNAPDESGT